MCITWLYAAVLIVHAFLWITKVLKCWHTLNWRKLQSSFFFYNLEIIVRIDCVMAKRTITVWWKTSMLTHTVTHTGNKSFHRHLFKVECGPEEHQEYIESEHSELSYSCVFRITLKDSNTVFIFTSPLHLFLVFYFFNYFPLFSAFFI